MSGKINLQNLKALKRAPQGTLAFRSYLRIVCRVANYINIPFLRLENANIH